MKTIWVVLLSLIAFVVCGFAGFTVSSASGALTSMRLSCDILETGEKKGFWTKAQRGAIVDNMMKKAKQRDGQANDVVKQLKGDCSKMPSF